MESADIGNRQSAIGNRKSDAPIGVFDSGVGGLTVVGSIQRLLPREDVIYLGDTARVPYGRKPPEMVVDFAVGIADFLCARGSIWIGQGMAKLGRHR